MIWICAEHGVDSIVMYLLLLSRAYTDPRPFLLLDCQTGKKVEGALEVGRRYSQDR